MERRLTRTKEKPHRGRRVNREGKQRRDYCEDESQKQLRFWDADLGGLFLGPPRLTSTVQYRYQATWFFSIVFQRLSNPYISYSNCSELSNNPVSITTITTPVRLIPISSPLITSVSRLLIVPLLTLGRATIVAPLTIAHLLKSLRRTSWGVRRSVS